MIALFTLYGVLSSSCHDGSQLASGQTKLPACPEPPCVPSNNIRDSLYQPQNDFMRTAIIQNSYIDIPYVLLLNIPAGVVVSQQELALLQVVHSDDHGYQFKYVPENSVHLELLSQHTCARGDYVCNFMHASCKSFLSAMHIYAEPQAVEVARAPYHVITPIAPINEEDSVEYLSYRNMCIDPQHARCGHQTGLSITPKDSIHTCMAGIGGMSIRCARTVEHGLVQIDFSQTNDNQAATVLELFDQDYHDTYTMYLSGLKRPYGYDDIRSAQDLELWGAVLPKAASDNDYSESCAYVAECGTYTLSSTCSAQNCYWNAAAATCSWTPDGCRNDARCAYNPPPGSGVECGINKQCDFLQDCPFVSECNSYSSQGTCQANKCRWNNGACGYSDPGCIDDARCCFNSNPGAGIQCGVNTQYVRGPRTCRKKAHDDNMVAWQYDTIRNECTLVEQLMHRPLQPINLTRAAILGFCTTCLNNNNCLETELPVATAEQLWAEVAEKKDVPDSNIHYRYFESESENLYFFFGGDHPDEVPYAGTCVSMQSSSGDWYKLPWFQRQKVNFGIVGHTQQLEDALKQTTDARNMLLIKAQLYNGFGCSPAPSPSPASHFYHGFPNVWQGQGTNSIAFYSAGLKKNNCTNAKFYAKYADGEFAQVINTNGLDHMHCTGSGTQCQMQMCVAWAGPGVGLGLSCHVVFGGKHCACTEQDTSCAKQSTTERVLGTINAQMMCELPIEVACDNFNCADNNRHHVYKSTTETGAVVYQDVSNVDVTGISQLTTASMTVPCTHDDVACKTRVPGQCTFGDYTGTADYKEECRLPIYTTCSSTVPDYHTTRLLYSFPPYAVCRQNRARIEKCPAAMPYMRQAKDKKSYLTEDASAFCTDRNYPVVDPELAHLPLNCEGGMYLATRELYTQTPASHYPQAQGKPITDLDPAKCVADVITLTDGGIVNNAYCQQHAIAQCPPLCKPMDIAPGCNAQYPYKNAGTSGIYYCHDTPTFDNQACFCSCPECQKAGGPWSPCAAPTAQCDTKWPAMPMCQPGKSPATHTYTAQTLASQNDVFLCDVPATIGDPCGLGTDNKASCGSSTGTGRVQPDHTCGYTLVPDTLKSGTACFVRSGGLSSNDRTNAIAEGVVFGDLCVAPPVFPTVTDSTYGQYCDDGMRRGSCVDGMVELSEDTVTMFPVRCEGGCRKKKKAPAPTPAPTMLPCHGGSATFSIWLELAGDDPVMVSGIYYTYDGKPKQCEPGCTYRPFLHLQNWKVGPEADYTYRYKWQFERAISEPYYDAYATPDFACIRVERGGTYGPDTKNFAYPGAMYNTPEPRTQGGVINRPFSVSGKYTRLVSPSCTDGLPNIPTNIAGGSPQAIVDHYCACHNVQCAKQPCFNLTSTRLGYNVPIACPDAIVKDYIDPCMQCLKNTAWTSTPEQSQQACSTKCKKVITVYPPRTKTLNVNSPGLGSCLYYQNENQVTGSVAGGQVTSDDIQKIRWLLNRHTTSTDATTYAHVHEMLCTIAKNNKIPYNSLQDCTDPSTTDGLSKGGYTNWWTAHENGGDAAWTGNCQEPGKPVPPYKNWMCNSVWYGHAQHTNSIFVRRSVYLAFLYLMGSEYEADESCSYGDPAAQSETNLPPYRTSPYGNVFETRENGNKPFAGQVMGGGTQIHSASAGVLHDFMPGNADFPKFKYPQVLQNQVRTVHATAPVDAPYTDTPVWPTGGSAAKNDYSQDCPFVSECNSYSSQGTCQANKCRWNNGACGYSDQGCIDDARCSFNGSPGDGIQCGINKQCDFLQDCPFVSECGTYNSPSTCSANQCLWNNGKCGYSDQGCIDDARCCFNSNPGAGIQCGINTDKTHGIAGTHNAIWATAMDHSLNILSSGTGTPCGPQQTVMHEDVVHNPGYKTCDPWSPWSLAPSQDSDFHTFTSFTSQCSTAADADSSVLNNAYNVDNPWQIKYTQAARFNAIDGIHLGTHTCASSSNKYTILTSPQAPPTETPAPTPTILALPQTWSGNEAPLDLRDPLYVNMVLDVTRQQARDSFFVVRNAHLASDRLRSAGSTDCESWPQQDVAETICSATKGDDTQNQKPKVDAADWPLCAESTSMPRNSNGKLHCAGSKLMPHCSTPLPWATDTDTCPASYVRGSGKCIPMMCQERSSQGMCEAVDLQGGLSSCAYINQECIDVCATWNGAVWDDQTTPGMYDKDQCFLGVVTSVTGGIPQMDPTTKIYARYKGNGYNCASTNPEADDSVWKRCGCTDTLCPSVEGAPYDFDIKTSRCRQYTRWGGLNYRKNFYAGWNLRRAAELAVEPVTVSSTCTHPPTDDKACGGETPLHCLAWNNAEVWEPPYTKGHYYKGECELGIATSSTFVSFVARRKYICDGKTSVDPNSIWAQCDCTDGTCPIASGGWDFKAPEPTSPYDRCWATATYDSFLGTGALSYMSFSTVPYNRMPACNGIDAVWDGTVPAACMIKQRKECDNKVDYTKVSLVGKHTYAPDPLGAMAIWLDNFGCPNVSTVPLEMQLPGTYIGPSQIDYAVRLCAAAGQESDSVTSPACTAPACQSTTDGFVPHSNYSCSKPPAAGKTAAMVQPFEYMHGKTCGAFGEGGLHLTQCQCLAGYSGPTCAQEGVVSVPKGCTDAACTTCFGNYQLTTESQCQCKARYNGVGCLTRTDSTTPSPRSTVDYPGMAVPYAFWNTIVKDDAAGQLRYYYVSVNGKKVFGPLKQLDTNFLDYTPKLLTMSQLSPASVKQFNGTLKNLFQEYAQDTTVYSENVIVTGTVDLKTCDTTTTPHCRLRYIFVNSIQVHDIELIAHGGHSISTGTFKVQAPYGNCVRTIMQGLYAQTPNLPWADNVQQNTLTDANAFRTSTYFRRDDVNAYVQALLPYGPPAAQQYPAHEADRISQTFVIDDLLLTTPEPWSSTLQECTVRRKQNASYFMFNLASQKCYHYYGDNATVPDNVPEPWCQRSQGNYWRLGTGCNPGNQINNVVGGIFPIKSIAAMKRTFAIESTVHYDSSVTSTDFITDSYIVQQHLQDTNSTVAAVKQNPPGKFTNMLLASALPVTYTFQSCADCMTYEGRQINVKCNAENPIYPELQHSKCL